MSASLRMKDLSKVPVFQFHSAIPRKYRGDPECPHYVPDSPLISRRTFTIEEELELVQVCADVLAEVPHSDEMTDNPFRYLASHITIESKTNLPINSLPQCHTETLTQSIQPVINTATPSETSKRDTFGTNTSTPFTTPGFTPGETDKRFSDAVRKQSINSGKGAQMAITSQKDKLYDQRDNQQISLSSKVAILPPSMTHSPVANPMQQVNRSASEEPETQLKVDPLFDSDLSKGPPLLPDGQFIRAVQTLDPIPAKRHTGLSRMLKTVKVKRIQSAPAVEPRKTNSVEEARHIFRGPGDMQTRKHTFGFASIFQRRRKNLTINESILT